MWGAVSGSVTRQGPARPRRSQAYYSQIVTSGGRSGRWWTKFERRLRTSSLSRRTRVARRCALCCACFVRETTCVLGLSPFVRARRSVSVCCPLFLCVGRCERLCHSPRACTPSTLSLRETSPHQPPHNRRPPRVTCVRGSRTLSSPRRGKDSAYRPERAGTLCFRQFGPGHTPYRAWGAAAPVPGEPNMSRQGGEEPSANLVRHIFPQLGFASSS